MDKTTSPFVSHILKHKYLYIYGVAILVLAVLLSAAFAIDALFINFDEAGFVDLDKIESSAGKEFDKSNTTEQSKENIFMMLVALPADHSAVITYNRNTSVVPTWDKLVSDNPDIATLPETYFGFSEEAYAALQNFYYNNARIDASLFGLGDVASEEEFTIKLKDARALVEQKSGAIVGIKSDDERQSYINFELFRTKFYNENATAVMCIFQLVILLAGIVGIMIFLAKSSGSYQIGLTPFFPAGLPWTIGLLAALVLLAPAAVYSLFAKNYVWSVIYLVVKTIFDALFLAFGWFLLRRSGICKGTLGKVLRIVLPLVANYAYYGLFLGIASIFSYDGYSAMDILTLAFPEASFWIYFILAPIFMTAVYAMTNSIVAMAVPMLTLTVANSIFPAVIATSAELKYPIYLLIVLSVGCAGLAIALLVLAALRIVKGVPLPTDLLCEAYPEGAPEITFPENYEEEQASKKRAKVEKARRKSDFAFLDEEAPAEEAPAEEASTEEEINV